MCLLAVAVTAPRITTLGNQREAESRSNHFCFCALSQATVLHVSHMIAQLRSHVNTISRQQNTTGGPRALMNRAC